MPTTLEERNDVQLDELEAWLCSEIDKSCEIYTKITEQCGKIAHWLMYYIPSCSCDPVRQAFICNGCHATALTCQNPFTCRKCALVVEIRWMERLK